MPGRTAIHVFVSHSHGQWPCAHHAPTVHAVLFMLSHPTAIPSCCAQPFVLSSSGVPRCPLCKRRPNGTPLHLPWLQLHVFMVACISLPFPQAPGSWGYGGSGMLSSGGQYEQYDEPFGPDDAITCMLDMEVTLAFARDRVPLGQVREQEGPTLAFARNRGCCWGIPLSEPLPEPLPHPCPPIHTGLYFATPGGCVSCLLPSHAHQEHARLPIPVSNPSPFCHICPSMPPAIYTAIKHRISITVPLPCAALRGKR